MLARRPAVRRAHVGRHASSSRPACTRGIRSLSPLVFSPNHDRRRDTSTLTYTLPDTETVQARVYDAAHRLVRVSGTGTLPAGTHHWTWDGRGAHGAHLRDGAYQVALSTVRGARRGWITHSWYLDTAAPDARPGPTGANTRFYPVHDGYRDYFTPDDGARRPRPADADHHRRPPSRRAHARGRSRSGPPRR